jgi:hypothetical protein
MVGTERSDSRPSVGYELGSIAADYSITIQNIIKKI